MSALILVLGTQNAWSAISTFRCALPTDARITRPPECPTRLTFTPAFAARPNLEEVRTALTRDWKRVYLCSGRAIEAAKLAGAPLYSGVGEPMHEYQFEAGGMATRTEGDSLPYYYDQPQASDFRDAGKPEVVRFQWDLIPDGEKIMMMFDVWTSQHIRLLRVNENQDLVVDESSASDGWMSAIEGQVCREGEVFQMLLVGFSSATS